MAGWLDNSFGHDVNPRENPKVGSFPCKVNQLQPTGMSTNNDDCTNIVPVHNLNQGAPSLAVESTARTCAQNISQYCQDQCKEINRTSSTLPPVTSCHSMLQTDKKTTNNQDSTKSSIVFCPPNNCRPINEGTRNEFPAVKRKVHVKKFQTPRNWEMKQISNLGSLTRKDTCVSVFAVVSYFFPPRNSGGPDMYFHFGLVDQTLYRNDKSLKCMCFQEFEQDIPFIASVGDIIKFPLRITIYRDNLQGRTFDDQFPWMTFDGRPGAPIVPRYSRSSAPAFTDADKKKVEELRSWAESIGLVEPNITLADLTDNLYFDFFCQVVYVDNGKNLLYVWDGTKPSFDGLSSNSFEMFSTKTKWGNKVVGKCVEVTVYGSDFGCTCKVGQYIMIPSLHFMLKDANASDKERGHASRIPVFTLHENVLSRRNIKVLDEGDNDVKVLKQRMEKLPTPDPRISQKLPVVNKHLTGKNTDLFIIPKVTQALKRKRVTENLVMTAEVFDAQASTTVDTTNEATVQPCDQKTIEAAIGSTSMVSDSNRAKKTRVHGSSNLDHTVLSGMNDETGMPSGGIPRDIRITQVIEPPLSEFGVSTEIISNPTASKVRMPPARVSSHGNTNERTAIQPAGVSSKINTKQVVTPTDPCRSASKETIVDPSNDSSIPTLHTIQEMRNETIATKFRCQARVAYAMPDKPERFVKFICKLCRHRYEMDHFRNGADIPDFSATVKCINPNCSASLSPTVQFSVILKDDTGLLDVSVTEKVARKFLAYTEPLKLLTDTETQRDVKQVLETLISKQDCMEFYIKRINLPNGKMFHSLANLELHDSMLVRKGQTRKPQTLDEVDTFSF